ncbi:hypothetical protein ACFOPQ_01395 [Deinococcus antarcticus]|uniref:ASCH domain-containing protein n=1 Tax=Deinococcus antarcticus TaxID=1298767 RepID=A0ABV8A2G4_9DEIO
MTPPILGLTLTHPWPVAIRDWGKDVENRTWKPSKWGGCVGMYLAIHGGKPAPKLDGHSEKAVDFRSDLGWIARQINSGVIKVTREQLEPYLNEEKDALEYAACVRPGIVAVARVAAVTTGHESPWAARNQFNWVLADVTPIDPIQYTGGRGLWEIEAYTKDQLRAAWSEKHDGEVKF